MQSRNSGLYVEHLRPNVTNTAVGVGPVFPKLTRPKLWPRRARNTKRTFQICIHSQFEECIRNLQHEDMRMIVFVADQHALARPSHSMLFIVLFQPSQAILYRRVFLGLCLFCAECVVAEWKESDGRSLTVVEAQGGMRWYRGLLVLCWHCRHWGDWRGRKCDADGAVAMARTARAE